MSKGQKITALIEGLQGQELDAHYLGYFECFNRQLYFEAHEVLEELWLLDRHGRNGAFYKGLIQLAGAFVHLQRDRPRPATALFKLAHANLRKYPPQHEQLAVAGVLAMIEDWLQRVGAPEFSARELLPGGEPELSLEPR